MYTRNVGFKQVCSALFAPLEHVFLGYLGAEVRGEAVADRDLREGKVIDEVGFEDLLYESRCH